MAFRNQYFHHFRSIIVLVLGFCTCASQASSRPVDGLNALSIRDRHERWMAKYGRIYEDLDEKEKRFNIFRKNVQYIENFNRAASTKNISYILGVNIFADLTDKEFKATYTGSRPSRPPTFPSKSISSGLRTAGFNYANISNMSPFLDWREKGAVTPIKDQEKCACCWAFASVAAIEALHQINTGNLISLSEAELNDCDKNNDGCKGGNIIEALMFIKQNQGLLTENQHPYKGVQGQCQTLQGDRVTINGFETVLPNDENSLLQVVFRQPVIVLVDSSGFQHYQSGIFNGDSGTNTDHDFTIIGFGTDDNGIDYWLVKNSWGTGWGEQGFIRIIRDKNMCGIVTDSPVYPV